MAPLLLAVRFALELTLLGTLGWLGFRLVDNTLAATLIAVAVVLATASVWGLLLSPRRRVNAPLGARVVVELLLFAVAAAGLALTGLPVAGISLFVIEVAVLGGLAALGYPPGSDAGRSPDQARQRQSPAQGDA
ncbi:MAG: YrdB family protein [Candidatus Nanopelagicales bacterium]